MTYDTNTGAQIADLHLLQPRLDAAWDLAGNARNILPSSWNRFMHPNMLTLPSALSDVAPFYTWYSCSTIMKASSADECAATAVELGWGYRTDNAGWDPLGWVLSPDEHYASQPNRIAPDLGPSYADQLVLAFERELGGGSAVELAFVDHVSGCGAYEDGRPIVMGDPTDWQTPRRYEVGFRVEF